VICARIGSDLLELAHPEHGQQAASTDLSTVSKRAGPLALDDDLAVLRDYDEMARGGTMLVRTASALFVVEVPARTPNREEPA